MTISGKRNRREQGRHSLDQGRMSLVSTAATKVLVPPVWGSPCRGFANKRTTRFKLES